MDFSETLTGLATLAFVLQHEVKIVDGIINISTIEHFEYMDLIEELWTELKLRYLQDVIPQLINIHIENHSIERYKKFGVCLHDIIRVLHLIQKREHFIPRKVLIKTYNISRNYVMNILAPIESIDDDIALYIYRLIQNLPSMGYNFKPRAFHQVISPKLRPQMVPSEKEIPRFEFASNSELWENLISQSNMVEVPRDTIKRCNISNILRSVGVVLRDDMGFVLELQIGDELIKSNDTKIHHWIIGGKRVSESDFRSALNGDYHPAYYRVFKNLIRFHLLVSARINELIRDL